MTRWRGATRLQTPISVRRVCYISASLCTLRLPNGETRNSILIFSPNAFDFLWWWDFNDAFAFDVRTVWWTWTDFNYIDGSWNEFLIFGTNRIQCTYRFSLSLHNHCSGCIHAYARCIRTYTQLTERKRAKERERERNTMTHLHVVQPKDAWNRAWVIYAFATVIFTSLRKFACQMQTGFHHHVVSGLYRRKLHTYILLSVQFKETFPNDYYYYYYFSDQVLPIPNIFGCKCRRHSFLYLAQPNRACMHTHTHVLVHNAH